MHIRFQLDENCTETEIIIRASQMSDEISEIMQKLSHTQQKLLAGFDNKAVELLDTKDVIRFYSSNQKVYAQTPSRELTIRLRLYELEERLDPKLFVRISHSEIVNLQAVQKIDLSLAGTICITFVHGITTYVSRRYVSKIKTVLGL